MKLKQTRVLALGTVLAGAMNVAAAQAAAPTDPQIAAIVVTANQVDIDAGKLAKSVSRSQEVKRSSPS